MKRVAAGARSVRLRAMKPAVQVLVVGAGPTGLALASHLLRLGVAVRVIDQKPGPSTTSKAIGLQYRVSEILACMGVADRFIARGGNPTAVNIYAGGRRLVQLRFRPARRQSGREAFEPRAIMIPQSETESILGDLLRERGGEVEWNTELVSFAQTADEVVCRLKRTDGAEEEVRCEWLVSCEGVHSAIRKQAGIGFAGKTYPLVFFLADVELEGPLTHGENYVWLHQEGSFAALPLPKPKTWRLLVDVTPTAGVPSGGRTAVTLDEIREIMRQRTGESRVTISNPTWVSEFRIHCRMVDRYRAGRVFLAGDAAHAHSPAGGQGIVTGIQDATNLAWKVARVIGGAPDSLLDTYEEERLPKAREVLKETDRTTTVLLAPSFKTRLFRDLILLPVMRNGWVQRKMFAKLSQLHVNYRGSTLSRDEGRRWGLSSSLRAGDRAPDVAFRIADSGVITTLFALLEPMRPIALIGKGAKAGDDSRLSIARRALSDAELAEYILGGVAPTLEDLHGDFRQLYGLTGEFLCVIRPDDHIGLIQRRIDPDALAAYLRLMSPMPG
jgi:2-polyprenyl-6-methoxyphenol hydroxylase-like FAD-dependent oxidoreductase